MNRKTDFIGESLQRTASQPAHIERERRRSSGLRFNVGHVPNKGNIVRDTPSNSGRRMSKLVNLNHQGLRPTKSQWKKPYTFEKDGQLSPMLGPKYRPSLLPPGLNYQVSFQEVKPIPTTTLNFEQKNLLLSEVYAMPASPRNKIIPLQTPSYDSEYIISYFSRKE